MVVQPGQPLKAWSKNWKQHSICNGKKNVEHHTKRQNKKFTNKKQNQSKGHHREDKRKQMALGGTCGQRS